MRSRTTRGASALLLFAAQKGHHEVVAALLAANATVDLAEPDAAAGEAPGAVPAPAAATSEPNARFCCEPNAVRQ